MKPLASLSPYKSVSHSVIKISASFLVSFCSFSFLIIIPVYLPISAQEIPLNPHTLDQPSSATPSSIPLQAILRDREITDLDFPVSNLNQIKQHLESQSATVSAHLEEIAQIPNTLTSDLKFSFNLLPSSTPSSSLSPTSTQIATDSASLILNLNCQTCHLIATDSSSVIEATVSASLPSGSDSTTPPSDSLPSTSAPISGNADVQPPIVNSISAIVEDAPPSKSDHSHPTSSPSQMPISHSPAPSQPGNSDHAFGLGGFGPATWVGLFENVYLPLALNNNIVSHWLTGIFLISMGRFVRLKSGRSPAFVQVT